MQTPEQLLRPRVKRLDDILGQSFEVLDDGFIRVIDYMGDDAAIVQAARVSYGAGTKKISDDATLIRYLMRHHHTTPLEMCEIKLHVRVPMDCWRQWIRHRTASVNEYSTRYSEAIDSAQKTKPTEWRSQAKGNRQGSGEYLDEGPGKVLSQHEGNLHQMARDIYDVRLKTGVAREQARKDLPLSTYTEAYWKIDLHNLLGFLYLRCDSHAQYEIRQYADIIANEILPRWCPAVSGAFDDYRRDAMTLSRIEREILSAVIAEDIEGALKLAHEAGWCDEQGFTRKRSRERDECESKFEKLEVRPPWAAPRD